MRPFLTLHDPATARGYYESGAWQNDTFYDLLVKHANHMPSAPATYHRGPVTLTTAASLAVPC